MIVLDRAISAIIELQSATGSIAKKQTIERYKDEENFRKLLYYALHPLLTYKVSEKTIRFHKGTHPSLPAPPSDIFALCDMLAAKRALDDVTVEQVQLFLRAFPTHEQELYILLLAKKLRLGVTAKTVNKVIPGLIPEWDVQQAYPIEKYPLFPGEWFALSQKLNGVRATYYRGNLYARSGEEHKGLYHLNDTIRETVGTDIVFDGELTLIDKGELSDNEAFRKATGIINADDGSPEKALIGFTVFDALPADEFDKGESVDSYIERRRKLDEVYGPRLESKCVKILPLEYAGCDKSMIPLLLDKMVREDKEGLMLNLDVPYKCKRHNGILKVKQFYTMDLPIIGCEEGSGRLKGKLGALVLDFNGNEVRVGSGFTDEERVDLWKRRNRLLGTLCEVKYKEISQDKSTGAESLQFPVYITLRGDKSVPSYG